MTNRGHPLPREFYLRDDVVLISRELLGKFLVTEFDGQLTAGMITETEAYRGPEDRASHAYANRRSARTEVMFKTGGIAYIYLCYGVHHLFNVVTNREDIPHAVLVRAIKPVEGIENMLLRRDRKRVNTTLCGGPGTLSKALGLHYRYSGTALDSEIIRIEDRGIDVPPLQITATPRVGVEYAGEDALLPWRFQITNADKLILDPVRADK